MGYKTVKRKLNKKALLVILLTLYLFIMSFYYVFTMPIKNIVIEGNSLISDSDIISAANIDNYPSIFKISSKKIIKNIKKINLIEEVNVSKSFTGTITINVKESKIVFFNKLNNTYVLSTKKEISDINSKNLICVPTLINYVPSDIYESLIQKLSVIDQDIIADISEIEYSPDIKDDVTINDSRFILRMNDGNYVYIDIVNFDNLNKYKVIYSSLEEKGVLHLDVVYSDNNTITFTSFAALAAQQKEKEGENDELSQ